MITYNINNKEKIKNGLTEAMGILLIDRMPTSKELRSVGYGWLDTAINRNGGLPKTAKEFNLTSKRVESKYNESNVSIEVLEVINIPKLERMPTGKEVVDTKGNYLHGAITGLGGYRYFAEKLKLPLKQSETLLGQDY